MSSFQEKPELYSRNLVVGLHPFRAQVTSAEKNSIIFIYAERETFTSGKKKC